MRRNLAEKMVFSLLAMRTRVSVPEITKRLGVSNSTVVGIIRRLREKGIVVQGPAVPTGRGRPTVRPRRST